MNILIVEDRDDNIYLLQALLTGHGHEVHAVANGAEALERLKSGGIDLIVTDVLMPVMDGFELCRKVKKDESFRHIPIIIYTATYTGPQDKAFAEQIGADCFLIKPCEPDSFMEAVRGVMEASKSGISAPAQTPVQEEEALKLYSERLVRNLELKMLQLEKEAKALRESEDALRRSEKKYRRLLESMADGFVSVDMQGNVVEHNEAYRKMLGYSEEELSRMTYMDLTPEKWHAFEQDIVNNQVLTAKSSEVYEKEYQRKNGEIFPVELRTFLVHDDSDGKAGMWAVVRDISERKRAEQEREKLQAQLVQSQKMETVGRLAGGIAHDFNNMLAIIFIAHALIKERLSANDPIQQHLNEIEYAACRSRDITRQLLAFSRKQIIDPKPCNLNALIADMQKTLARLVGEDIELRFFPQHRLGQIMIDPSQVDQILLNLAVNARDAMPHGGKIAIETANADFDDAYCENYHGFKPGGYVCLMFNDNGAGMDKETLAHIFEPFFTTKETRKGTGLGLATIYGIVKQNNGFINAYSEVGLGTSFKIYLPRIAEAATEEVTQHESAAVPHGNESILVVEDDEFLCQAITLILEHLGYSVTAAASPAESLEKVKQAKTRFDLLFTDIVMPGMNGAQLRDSISALRPEIKVLFMSGYTSDAIVHRGVLDEGVNFIQKPFSAEGLARKIREVLDRQNL